MEAEAEPPRPGERIRALLWPPPPVVLAGAYAALVAALGLWGLAFDSRLPSRLPSSLDWQAAANLLERDALPGDAVALSPMWAERAREVLPASLPVMAFPRYARETEDLVGVRRVWLLSLPFAPGFSGTIEADLSARADARDGPQRLGALRVTRYDLRSPTLPLAWLPDLLARARVALGDRPCLSDSWGAFRCPGPSWVRVAREVREIDYLPRPCLYAHPDPDPRSPLSIEFPAVPMGRALRGHTGIIGDAALGGRAPVRLTVKVENEELATVEEGPRRPGWHLFHLDTSRDAGHTLAVTFLVSSADASQRWFCFEAMTLP
jgi:hypothetical protein